MRAIDAHLHLWDPARLDYDWLSGPLRRRFGVAEWRSAVADAPASGEAVFVQSESIRAHHLDEVAWVASLAGEIGVRGIVAGAQLNRGAETMTHLDALERHPLVVGVRHILHDQPDGFAGTEAFRAGAAALAERGLTFDACVRSGQIVEVATLAADVPQLAIVLDHLGKPEIGTASAPRAPSARWLADLADLATHPNTLCKLSGLPAESDGAWTAEQVVPFLDAAAAAFGDQRLMFGSDWPVSAVAASGEVEAGAIAAWTRVVVEWAVARGHDVDAVLWRNAERFYRLGR